MSLTRTRSSSSSDSIPLLRESLLDDVFLFVDCSFLEDPVSVLVVVLGLRVDVKKFRISCAKTRTCIDHEEVE